jgi:hypothetical protein
VRIIGTQGRLTSGLAPAARSKLTFATPWMSRARKLSSGCSASVRQCIRAAEDSNRQGCRIQSALDVSSTKEGRSPYGNLVTKASRKLWLKVVSKAPEVVGKSAELVIPVTKALPSRTAMPLP